MLEKFGKKDGVPELVSRWPMMELDKTCIEELKLVCRATNAIRKQKDISCQNSAAFPTLRQSIKNVVTASSRKLLGKDIQIPRRGHS